MSGEPVNRRFEHKKYPGGLNISEHFPGDGWKGICKKMKEKGWGGERGV